MMKLVTFVWLPSRVHVALRAFYHDLYLSKTPSKKWFLEYVKYRERHPNTGVSCFMFRAEMAVLNQPWLRYFPYLVCALGVIMRTSIQKIA